MKTFQLTPEALSAIAAETAEILKIPGAVALVPTETVYGLVARRSDPAAIENIIRLKHREATKVLGWFVGDWRKLPDFGVKMKGLPEKLAERYCPGPITIIAPADNGGTVGFRVPDHPFLAELLRLMKEPLVQTSANRSGMPDARSAAEAAEMLAWEPDAIVEAGLLPPGSRSSTVVDATGIKAKILRQGTLELAAEFL